MGRRDGDLGEGGAGHEQAEGEGENRFAKQRVCQCVSLGALCAGEETSRRCRNYLNVNRFVAYKKPRSGDRAATATRMCAARQSDGGGDGGPGSGLSCL